MAKKNLPMSLDDIKKRMKVSADGGRSRLQATGGNVIGTRNERFTYKGQLIGDRFTCTVLDFAQQNAYYSGDFDSDNIQPPDCIALSLDGEGMGPPANVPNAQSTHCDGCPQNAFGSAAIGRGKACKNQYRLLVIPDNTKDAREVEAAVLTLPPTSIKPWNEYVQKLAAFGLAPWGVKTTFYFDNEDLEATFKQLLPDLDKYVEHKDVAFLGSVLEMEEVNRDLVLQYPDFSNYEAPPPGGRSKKSSAKPKAKAKAKSKAQPKSKAAPKSRASRSKFS